MAGKTNFQEWILAIVAGAGASILSAAAFSGICFLAVRWRIHHLADPSTGAGIIYFGLFLSPVFVIGIIALSLVVGFYVFAIAVGFDRLP
jgi:hypothetical protein